MKEAETQRQQLEQKFLEVEKEKQEAMEEKAKALSSLEEQVHPQMAWSLRPCDHHGLNTQIQ